MRNKVLLEKSGKWSVVPCRMNGPMLETGDRNFLYESEAEALSSICEDYVEMHHDLMPLIFGDSYRRIFVHKNDFEGVGGIRENLMTNNDFFEHITLTTGNIVKQFRLQDEASRRTYISCASLLDTVFEKTRGKIVDEYDLIAHQLTRNMFNGAIVHQNQPTDEIIKIAISLDSSASKKLWPIVGQGLPCPSAPWIAVKVTSSPATFIRDLKLYSWAGSFEACLAWGFKDWAEKTVVKI